MVCCGIGTIGYAYTRKSFYIRRYSITGGKTYKFRGSLCADFEVEGIDPSDPIRDAIEMNDLYVFDGNWLHHFTKIPS